jgi:transposase InsO family protein
MLMPHVTGKQFSIHRIRRLMKKYGMETNIRRPSKNRKAMKELIERNRKSNLLLRRFRLHRPNEVRLTDVTYLDYGDEKRAYGSASIDPATGRLICFVISKNNDLQLALDTLDEMDKYPAKRGAIFHSDQGILYMTDDFQAAVVERELDQSMSRRGNCWDNAPQEAFFGHFKDESGYEKCRTLKELRDTVKRYAVYYNEERKIWERGRMTPVEYEAWLNAMSESEFQTYLEAEEEKYKKAKEESAKKAIKRAREYHEDTLAALEERNETGKA